MHIKDHLLFIHNSEIVKWLKSSWISTIFFFSWSQKFSRLLLVLKYEVVFIVQWQLNLFFALLRNGLFFSRIELFLVSLCAYALSLNTENSGRWKTSTLDRRQHNPCPVWPTLNLHLSIGHSLLLLHCDYLPCSPENQLCIVSPPSIV